MSYTDGLARFKGPRNESGSAGAQRLRDLIDRGRTGDKVAHPDPAAAPLGTDDEAAGTPPTPEQVRRAYAAEALRTSLRQAAQDRARPHLLHRAARSVGLWMFVGCVAIFVVGTLLG